MRLRVVFAVVLASLVVPAFAADPVPGYVPAGRKTVAVGYVDQVWHDSDRKRDVPVRIYYPRTNIGPCPVILFSHGLGGNDGEYGYLGRYWAANGYVVVYPQHLGSDTAALLSDGINNVRRRLKEIGDDTTNAFNRAADISFTIDELKRRNADPKWSLHGQVDLERIGMAGHSFGGNTTLMIAGQTFGVRQGDHKFVDPRVKCAVSMSPPVAVAASEYDQSFAGITIPTMILTGTEDNWPVSENANDERQAAFKSLTHCPAYLLTLDGADHFVFLGDRFGRSMPNDKPHHELIRDATLAMFDAYLRDDKGVRDWLDQPTGLTADATARHAIAVCHDPRDSKPEPAGK